MRVIRLYVNQGLALNNEFNLDDATRHHAMNVLRLNKNSSLILFNGDGYDYPCEILAFNKKAVDVKVTGQIDAVKESPLATNLLLAVSKSSHMDYAIQKTVEAGVSDIYPVVSERTVTKLSTKSKANKHQHWQRIIISACEQCGRATLPALHEVTDLTCLKNLRSNERGFVLDANSNQTLSKFSQEILQSVWLLVGPEGGLTRPEINLAQTKGYQFVAFGPRVLRTETATLSVVICAQLLWGDLGRDLGNLEN